MKSPRVFDAKRDDFPFLGKRSLHATLLPVTDRKHTRLAGSRSEAQPPGAKMAVREKSVSRVWGSVKHYTTYCGQFFHATIFWSLRLFQASCHHAEAPVVHHPV